MKQLNSSQGIEEYQNVAMEKNNSKKPQKNKTKKKKFKTAALGKVTGAKTT